MKKITAALLVVAMLASMAACNKTEQVETTTGTDTTATDTTTVAETAETRAMHAVPDTLDFGGESFLVNSFSWNAFEYYFFADEANGDAMNDAIYNRKVKVEEYLNVSIGQELEARPDYNKVNDKIKSTVQAGDDVYSLALIHVISGVSELSSTGMLYNFDALPYIDTTADWWNRAQMDMLRLGKNSYYGVSDYVIPCPSLVFFNKELVADHALDDPYTLVYEGKWTLDKFVDMATSITTDLNGDGKYTTDDIGGVCASDISVYTSILPACDQFLTSRDANNRIKLDMNNEKTIDILEKVYKLVENPGTLYVDSGSFTIDTGRLLFYLSTISYAETLRDCDIDVGMVPYPKYDEAQENYISHDWGGLMCIPSSIQNPEKVGAVLELLSWESANEVIPAYYDVILSGKLARDEDSKNMLDILFDTIAYEIGGNYFGFSSGFGDLFYTVGKQVITNKSTDFASWYAKNEKSAISTIDKFYEALEKVEG